MFGDVRGLQQRHYPYDILYLVEKIKGFPLDHFEILQNIKNSGEGFYDPPPCTTGGGTTLRVRPKVKGSRSRSRVLGLNFIGTSTANVLV